MSDTRPLKREDVPERAAGEQHDQQHREQEGRDGIADDDHGGRPDIEFRTVTHRFCHAQRNRDDVGNKGQPKPQRDRNRQLLLDQFQHRHIAEIALPEIEHGVVPDHQEEAFVRRLVEAELLFQLLDEFRVEALARRDT